MKRFYIGLNIVLIILIVLTISLKPKLNTIGIDTISKNVTTSVFTGVKQDKEIEVE